MIMKLTERLSRRSAVRFAGIGTLGAALAGVAGRTAERVSAAPGNNITGSWEAQTDDPIRFALQTFTIDGGFISTHGQHLSRTPAHGAWVQTGEGRFFAELVNYGFQSGATATRRVTRLDITLDPSGNSYTANDSVEEFDLAGNSLGTNVHTSSATRITPHLPR